MSKPQDPKKHHYVPQFYLRMFRCSHDENKVPTVSKHNPFLIKKDRSIANIGYEDNLYTISDKDIEISIEKSLNKTIETPISQSSTWKKIEEGMPNLLTEEDKLNIYIFVRHLESRNVETLEFIKKEQIRVNDPRFRSEYTAPEISMHEELASIPSGAEQFYLGMSGSIDQYFDEYSRASISIFGSNIPIRTSTNPVMHVPMHIFENREFDKNNIAKWLPLSPSVGAMLFMNDKYCDFSNHQVVEDNVIRTLNRLYVVQLIKSITTRHMIVNDEYLVDDLAWAGIEVDSKNPRKFKCPK